MASNSTTMTCGVSTVSSSFAYDSDEEPPEEEPSNQFFWRLPPEESHSDWTIEIITNISSSSSHLNDGNDDDGDDDVNNNLCYKPPGAPAAATAPALLESKSDSSSPRSLRSSPSLESVTRSTINGTTTTTVYHVHKCILAAGPRRCEYFTRLFQSDSFSEAQSRTSRIELHALAAAAFPAMLDYVYMTREPLCVTAQTATALHFLGQYFENRKLRWDAKQFWKRDLEFHNCHVYYQHAKVFSDDKILDAITKCCIDNFFCIQASSAVVEVTDPAFWPGILEPLDITKEASLHASYLVTQVCMLHKDHPDQLTPELFDTLTSEEFLPHIYEAVAKDLLDLHDHFRPKQQLPQQETKPAKDFTDEEYTLQNDDDDDDDDDDTDDKKKKQQPRQSLSSLQWRCINALAENWRGLPVTEDGLSETLRSQDPVVLSELLAKALFHAQEKVERDEKHLSRLRHSLDERDAELAKTEQRLQEANAGWLRALYEVQGLKTELKQAKDGWRQAHQAWEKEKAKTLASSTAIPSSSSGDRRDKTSGRDKPFSTICRSIAPWLDRHPGIVIVYENDSSSA